MGFKLLNVVMEISADKETFEYWESNGHIIARSKGSYDGLIEVPVDIVSRNGCVIPKLVGEYIRNFISSDNK